MRSVSAVMFFPRGGSAHVTRALARELPEHGWEQTILSGSLPGLGDAGAFYSGLDIHAVDFSAGDAPMHPSYEDRRDAPDRVFADVDDADYEEHVSAWAAALLRARADEADVLHLHHLTPINEAALRVAPHVPVVGHLHGTELLMLERIAEDDHPGWRHAAAWRRRMRRWAQRCDRIIVLAEGQVERAVDTLGVEPSRITVSPNGFDPALFHRREIDRHAFWERHLVRTPRGWRPGEGEGTIRYTLDDIARLTEGPIVISVGRFTEVKRTALLVRAFAHARRATDQPASLVLVGGHPGEWEGEHPYDAARMSGCDDVFLAGWHDHKVLPSFFSAADVVALASVREQFGNVLVEGMACGLPAIAVDRCGPTEIVDDGQTGWLVEPDDVHGLAGVLAHAIDDGAERRRRGESALQAVGERYAWPAVAAGVATVLDAAAADGSRDDDARFASA
jgi:glycosyltransferase involved in cell wall biosynthesis